LKARKKLGEILVEGGLLTQEQLEKALPYQKKSNLKNTDRTDLLWK
jgi:hypothetical protein